MLSIWLFLSDFVWSSCRVFYVLCTRLMYRQVICDFRNVESWKCSTDFVKACVYGLWTSSVCGCHFTRRQNLLVWYRRLRLSLSVPLHQCTTLGRSSGLRRRDRAGVLPHYFSACSPLVVRSTLNLVRYFVHPLILQGTSSPTFGAFVASYFADANVSLPHRKAEVL